MKLSSVVIPPQSSVPNRPQILAATLAASLALSFLACGGAPSLAPSPLSGAADGTGAPPPPIQTTFVVSGIVRSGDTPVANVAIELEGPERYNTQSDPEGAYRFAQVARGEYALRAFTAGFSTAEQRLMVEADVTSDLSLTPASPPAPSPAPTPAPTPNPTPTPSPTPAPNPSPNPTPAPPSAAPTPAPSPTPTPSPTLHRLYGRTTEVFGSLPDVRVDLVSGPDAGRTTYSAWSSSTSGARYEFRDLRSGAYVVRFSRGGHQTRDVQQELRGDTELNVQLELVPLPPQTGALEGTVQDSVSYQALEGVRVVATGGAGAGRATTTNGTGFFRLELPAGTSTVRFSKEGYDSREVEYPISAGATTINAGPTLRKTGAPPPLPPSPSLYFGYVTDGQGRPVVGANVCGSQYCGYTDANGRYEFQGWSGSSRGQVYPPDGYEPKPVRVYLYSFPLYPGGQNITIRRITKVSMSPPATLAVGALSGVFAQVSFDDGKTESPVRELFFMTSSDPGVVNVGSGSGSPKDWIQGVKEGIASVSGRYFGVSSATFQVQVVR